MPLNRRLAWVAAVAVGVAILLVSIVCYMVVKSQLRGQVDNALRAQATLLEQGDHYMHLSDFADYAQKHEQAARDYCDSEAWAARAIINVARSARFSSDRTNWKSSSDASSRPRLSRNSK